MRNTWKRKIDWTLASPGSERAELEWGEEVLRPQR